MNKQLAALMATAAFAFSVAAAPINITINDGLSKGKNSSLYYGTEDESLNYGSTWGQEWDLEALYFDKETSELQLVSGFDIYSVHEQQIMLGDIFIKSTGSDVWSYAVTFNRNGGELIGNEYKIVDLTAGDYDEVPLQGNFEFQKPGAKPYAIANWNSSKVIATGAFTFGSLNETDLIGDKHFLLAGIDLSPVTSLDNSITIHQTMSCGNDVIRGKVPEPTILTLLGLSFIGLTYFRRKRN